MASGKSAYVIAGRQEHADAVAGRLRYADQQEIYAATGKNPDVMLYQSWITSPHRWSIVRNGEIIGLFGLTPAVLMGDVGVPWLLGTDEMEKIRFTFAKQSIEHVKHMLHLYPTLANYVDVRNVLAIKWLKWLGFTLDAEPRPYGYQQLPFYYFEKRRV